MPYPTRSVWAAAVGMNLASENRLHRVWTVALNACGERQLPVIAENISSVGPAITRATAGSRIMGRRLATIARQAPTSVL
jgi:hypothetical protein